jgi:PAS domain S-box-containing protein
VGLYILNETTNELCGTFGVDPQGNLRDERANRESLTEDHWFWQITRAENKVLVAEEGSIFDFHSEIGHGVTAAAALWNGQRAIGCLVADNFVHHRKKRPYEAELISLLGNTFGHLIEQKNAENRLNESEKRFRQLVENAGDIIYRVDADGCFTYINPSGLSRLGYAESELLGRHYLDLCLPELRAEMAQFYDQQVFTRTLNTYHEVPVITAGGQTIILGQNVQIVLQNGQVTGLQAQARDITERKSFEDALAVARDQALAASKVKSQMLSQVNHELRTPLGAILGYAELLRNGMFGPISAEQQGALVEIIDSVNYQTEIVNDLLDTAQLEARKMSLSLELCRPREIFKQVETTLSVLAHKKNLQFSIVVAPDLPEQLLCDERRLNQILINLGGNAIKFTRTGEVQILARCSSASFWTIQVRDTGIGIPPDAQAYIFEPFRQVKSSSTADQRGTGLGLTITRQLVELMGGTITLESEPGHGSTFTVRLPIQAHAAPDARQSSAA